jgi:exopolyphosphatase/guanosine-5'-triphosphate,3'-diphosphate pyrophosphatase
MRAAAIDVGSNTLRMLIGDIYEHGITRVSFQRTITRLAQGMIHSGVLGEKNMRESLLVLKGFSQSLADCGMILVRAVGTSALREAKNGQDFIETVLRETAIRIETISGMREAELTLRGVTLGMGTAGGSLIIDIGGGSTEWILSQNGSPQSTLYGSLPLGVVTLCERFLTGDPPSRKELSALSAEIDIHLQPLRQEFTERAVHPTHVVGTGGSITTLASMDLCLDTYDHEKINRHPISLHTLYALRERLLSLPLNARQAISGLEPKRADLIIPGILLTIRWMELFETREIVVSDFGLLEGLLREACDENRL